MNIDDMTLKQIKEVAALASGLCGSKSNSEPTLNSMIGEKVIIRTYSAGVFFGTLSEKAGCEVILTDARRLYYWVAKKSISLSAVANYGLKGSSKVTAPIDKHWLNAIEIIPCTTVAIKSIEGQEHVEAS